MKATSATHDADERGAVVNASAHLVLPQWVWAVAALYAVLGALLLDRSPALQGAVVFWPVSGLAVGTLVLLSPRARLSATGLFAVAHFVAGIGSVTAWFPHAVFSLVTAIEVWLAASVITGMSRRALTFDRISDVGRLFIAGLLVTAGIAGVLSAGMASAYFGDQFLAAWRNWWIPDALGILLLTPVVVRLYHQQDWRRLTMPRVAEALVLTAVTVYVAGAMFFIGRTRIPLSVGVLPLLVWAALRFGVTGTALCITVLWGYATWATAADLGPFANLASTQGLRLAWSAAYIAVTGGSVLAMAAAIAERAALLTDLEASVTDLQDAYTRAQATIVSAPNMVAAIDTKYHLIAFNPRWAEEYARLAGQPPTIGMDLQAALASRATAWAHAALVSWESALAGERRSERRGAAVLQEQREILVEVSPIRDSHDRVIGAIQVNRDVSDESRRQAAESHARKLESMGQLAGGIAHDFNNIITGIVSYAALLEEELQDDDPKRADVQEISRAAGRAADLVSQLLAFARRRDVTPKVLDPNLLVAEAERLLRRLMVGQIEFATEPAHHLWSVRVDAAQFEQVLVNLALNARDAVEHGGKVVIATENRTLSASDLARFTPAVASGPGDYVEVRVSDNGHGIPPELLDRIFEPFFTTKEMGKGTGLGLATAAGIVQQAGGGMRVESVVGVGTVFIVALPRAVEEAA